MLQVCIHNGDNRRARRQHPFDAGACEAAPSNSAQATDAGVIQRQLLRAFGRAIRRVVVDENGFPADAGKRDVEAPDQFGDVFAFLECRNDDRKLRCAGVNGRNLIWPRFG